MMFWLLYNAVFVVAILLMLPKYLGRMRKRGGYRRGFMQRFGCYRGLPVAAPRGSGMPRLWIHAVSVGEMFIALRMRDALRRAWPAHDVVLTTNTSTAYALAEKRLAPGETLLYFPLDFAPCMRRAFNYINPGMILLMECELWPNLLREAGRRGIPVGVANARLSDRSFAGYRRFRWLFRRVLPSLTAVCAQTPGDAARFEALGVPADRIHVTGNAKYDLIDAESQRDEWARGVLGVAGIHENCRVILGGSTWPGEEACLMDMLPRIRRNVDQPVSLVIAPRHVERRADIVAAAHQRGLRLVTRRDTEVNRQPPDHPAPDVFLVDTTGELQRLYCAATVIFVGKSLTAHGGQNPIEPAAGGGAVIIGPHTENFSDVVDDLLGAEAILQVADASGLERQITGLLLDPQRRAQLGHRAAAAVRRYRGAIQRTLEHMPPPRTVPRAHNHCR